MRLILTYMISFMFMRYMLNMSTIDIIMLQGFVISVVLLFFIVKSFKEFLNDYKENSNKILGEDKKILKEVSLLKIRGLITFVILAIIIFITLLKIFPVNNLVESIYNWEIPLQKAISILDYLNRVGITLALVVIIGYINYIFRLNKQRKDYNIVFDKFIYYLKYTSIRFLIYLSHITIIIIAPFMLDCIRI